MSSCPFTSAFHCSLGLNSDAPGYTCTSSSTPAALASRAMICTISSRTSPLPPGNWCDALSTVGAANALPPHAASSAANMPIRPNFVIGLPPPEGCPKRPRLRAGRVRRRSNSRAILLCRLERANSGRGLLRLALEQQPDERHQLLFLFCEEVIGAEDHGLARAARALEQRGALGRALQHGVVILLGVDVVYRELRALPHGELAVRHRQRDPARERHLRVRRHVVVRHARAHAVREQHDLAVLLPAQVGQR